MTFSMGTKVKIEQFRANLKNILKRGHAFLKSKVVRRKQIQESGKCNSRERTLRQDL